MASRVTRAALGHYNSSCCLQALWSVLELLLLSVTRSTRVTLGESNDHEHALL